MFEKFAAIVGNTFTESIRQPIFVVMLIVGALLLVLNPSLSAYTLDDDNKLLTDLGLSTIFLGGLFLAAFTATGVLSREIENKTVLSVISKPIGRPMFVVGKFFGVAGALSVAFWVWSIIFLLTARHKVMSTASDEFDMPVILFGTAAVLVALGVSIWGNYFYGWIFSSTFSGWLAVTLGIAWFFVLLISSKWEVQSLATDIKPQLLIALALILEAVWVLCAIAIACSTRMKQVMTLVVYLAVFLVGLSSDYIFGTYSETYPIAKLLYAIAPNMQVLWLADALTQENPVTLTYLGTVSGYTALYTAAVLSLAVALFQTRQVS